MLAALTGNLTRDRDRLDETEGGDSQCSHKKGAADVALEHPSDREVRDSRHRTRYFADHRDTEPVDAQHRNCSARGNEGHDRAR